MSDTDSPPEPAPSTDPRRATGIAAAVRHRDVGLGARLRRWTTWPGSRGAFGCAALGAVATAVEAVASGGWLATTLGACCWAFFWGCLTAGGLLAVVQAGLSLPWTPLAVARVVLIEALRKRGAWIAIAGLLAVVCILPLLLSGETRLHFRVQSFLTYALGVTTFVTSLASVLLSCETLAVEVAQRQAHVNLVKPIRRGGYLFGKWLGVMLLNLVVLASVGVVVWDLGHRQVARASAAELQQSLDARDLRAAVETLGCRRVVAPEVPTDFAERARARLDEIKQRDPIRAASWTVEPLDWALREEDRAWRCVEVGETQSYRFVGVSPARDVQDQVVLRLRVRAYVSDVALRLELDIEGKTQTLVCSANEVTDVPIPVAALADQVVEVVVTNPEDPQGLQPSVVFTVDEGLTLLYPQGGFVGNWARGLSMTGIRLSVLVALGLLASSCLGFPVASLTALLLAVAASASSYVLSDDDFVHPDQSVEVGSGWGDRVFDVLERSGIWVTRGLQTYGVYSPNAELVSGRRISWERLGRSSLALGLAWCGVLGGLAWWIFGRRELARVQV